MLGLNLLDDYISLICEIINILEAIKIAIIFNKNEEIVNNLINKIAQIIKFNKDNKLLDFNCNNLIFNIYYNESKYIIKSIDMSYFFDIKKKEDILMIETYKISIITTELIEKINIQYKNYKSLYEYVNDYKLLFMVKNNYQKDKNIKNMLCNLFIL